MAGSTIPSAKEAGFLTMMLATMHHNSITLNNTLALPTFFSVGARLTHFDVHLCLKAWSIFRSNVKHATLIITHPKQPKY